MTLVEFLTARFDEDAEHAVCCGKLGSHFHAARVLREVEAKRAIVDANMPTDGCPGCPGCCLTIAHLAAVYADHPDYDEAWRP